MKHRMSVSLVAISTISLVASVGAAAHAQPGGGTPPTDTSGPSVQLEEVTFSHSITLAEADVAGLDALLRRRAPAAG